MESDNKSKAMELRAIASRLLLLAEQLDPEAGRAYESGSNDARMVDGGLDLTGSYAEAIFRDRQRRAKYFPDVPFADPAWDLLLDLYFRGARGEVVTVSNACVAAGVPTSTALRWIDILIDLGLIIREADVEDRRRTLLTLTPASRDSLKAYFTDLVVDRFRGSTSSA